MPMRRVTCEFCGLRVRVGAAGRVYRHNSPSGAWCIAGSWVKAPPLDDEMLTPENMQKWQDIQEKKHNEQQRQSTANRRPPGV